MVSCVGRHLVGFASSLLRRNPIQGRRCDVRNTACEEKVASTCPGTVRAKAFSRIEEDDVAVVEIVEEASTISVKGVREGRRGGRKV